MLIKKRVWLIILVLLFLFVNINFSSGTDNYDDVLLVTNDQSSISLQIGEYFAEQRSITHWLNISVYDQEVTPYTTFNNSIRTPIENYITSNNLQNKINYIVTTKGVPLRHDKYLCED